MDDIYWKVQSFSFWLNYIVKKQPSGNVLCGCVREVCGVERPCTEADYVLHCLFYTSHFEAIYPALWDTNTFPSSQLLANILESLFASILEGGCRCSQTLVVLWLLSFWTYLLDLHNKVLEEDQHGSREVRKGLALLDRVSMPIFSRKSL